MNTRFIYTKTKKMNLKKKEKKKKITSAAVLQGSIMKTLVLLMNQRGDMTVVDGDIGAKGAGVAIKLK